MFSVLTNMVIMYVDIVLLMILLCLILCVCTYCVVRIRRMQQSGHVTVLLRPTRVMFSHKNEDNGKEELRTVVAYQNPFTGDYCVRKSRPARGYVNELPGHSRPRPARDYVSALPATSPDSGLSDEYEPLKPVAGREGDYGPFNIQEHGILQSVAEGNRDLQSTGDETRIHGAGVGAGHRGLQSMVDANSVNKTWNWNYKEYQI